MVKSSDVQQKAQETKEKDKVRREKLAGYFFNLSQLTFVALVLGGITPLYANDLAGNANWYVIFSGVALTVILANIGNRILK